jgi:cation:H+ antiporter
MSPKLARPVAPCVALTVPAVFLRLSGAHPAAALSLAAFGTAVVAASFLLAWGPKRPGSTSPGRWRSPSWP